jgi:hypothetical protein
MPQSISGGALPWQRLAVINHHERDDRITFEEASHIYSVDGVPIQISVTSLIGSLHKHFNADEIIRKMRANAQKFAVGPYYGKTDDEIKAGWDKNRDEASGAGTRIHLDIEHYYNSDPIGNLAGDNYEALPSKEWEYFLEYQRKHGSKFTPFRTEWLVWDISLNLAGSIDMVYRRPDGDLAIYDWKRTKELKLRNDFDNMLGPCSHLPDVNYWHYAIQLNVYRRILQTCYGENVTALALVVLHPNNPTYQVVKLPMLDDIIDEIFEARRRAVAQGGGAILCF